MVQVVQFDAARHIYTVSGRWVPGVTRVLADCGYIKGAEWFTEESRIRGRQVHLACQWADQHAPDATTLDEVLEVLDIAPAIHPYLQGWLLFKKETEYQSGWWERPMCLSAPLVAGTPDSLGWFGKAGVANRRKLIDIKSWASQGAKPKISAVLQTAGYRLMIKEVTGQDADRIVVKLPGDGRYRMYECHDNDNDEFIFKCHVHGWWHRLNNGLIEREGPEVDLAA